MNRRDALLTGVPALAAASLGLPAASTLAQKPVPRIGFLILASLPSVGAVIDGFRSHLRELGHVDGSTIQIDVVSADGHADRLPQLAEQLVARKADIIISGGGNVSALAARQATSTIPIIMTSAVGPVEAGLVQSLARPGGNVTGLSVPRELGLKQLQLLQEMVPGLSRVAILLRHDPALVAVRSQATAMAQQLLQLTLDRVEVRSPEDLARALEGVRAARSQALIMSSDPLLYQQREQILRFARNARIADMYPTPEVVEAGGLVSYAPTADELSRGVARFVDRLLKGAKPADLPVEQPTKFELVMNLKTARSLGLKIPQSLLLRADRVIE